MRKLIYIYIFILFGCSFMKTEDRNINSTLKAADLELVIDSDKEIYDVKDGIIVSIKLINNAGQDIIVNTRLAPNYSTAPSDIRDVYFVISTSSEGVVPFDGFVHVFPIDEEDFVTLSPKDFVQKTYDLTDVYKLEGQKDFVVYAVYENQTLSNKDGITWIGKVVSNSITFAIK